MLDVLVEVHNLPEMERALDLDGVDLLGINNRNLKTFETDLATTEKLAEEAPDNVLLVSESGIRNPADAQKVLEYGANAILVGETLMRSHIPAETIQEFLALSLES
jgi:indole-3-glycerol phosphate synthase